MSKGEPQGTGVVSKSAMQKLRDLGLHNGVTRELSVGEACTHVRFLFRSALGFGGVRGYTSTHYEWVLFGSSRSGNGAIELAAEI